jgi:hypothetical protein
MDDWFRRGAALRGPMNDANRNSGCFEVVDADAVQATYVNGTLQLRMQKLAVTKRKKISVA